ncbi:MAG: serine hydrolase domain-containing protein, partial [Chromatocurvus sp.]
NNSPSGTVAIAHRGEVIFAKGYGYQDVEEGIPVRVDETLFRPGSVSKLFTWVAVMQLVEQGKLDLDTDVNEYLETFQIEDSWPEPITLRHIMTHTAGFEDGGLGYLIVDDPANTIPLAEAMAKYQTLRVNPPGAQTAYSNYATALAGLIVANASGESFNDYIKRHIFEPLAMSQSSFEEPLPEALADHMAASYKLEAGAFLEKPFEIVASFGPAGALSSTATDMLRFAEAIRNGGALEGQRILAEETVTTMLAPAFSHDDRLMGMALGFYANNLNGNRVMGHGGDTQWFHSVLGIDQGHELSVFASFGGSGGSAVRSALLPALYDKFFPRAHTSSRPGSGEPVNRYAGSYGFWRVNFSNVEKAMGLAGGLTIAPGPDNSLTLIMGPGAKQYREIDDNLFEEISSQIALPGGLAPRRIAFQENPSGEITGFVLDDLPFMSTRKLALYETQAFNLGLLGLSALLFIGVLARCFFQRRELAHWAAADRSAYRAAVFSSAAHLITLVGAILVLPIVVENMMVGIPQSFKLWLWLPISASLTSLWLLYACVRVWLGGLFAGLFARLRFSIVTAASLFMLWFYYFWNFLGFQYF